MVHDPTDDSLEALRNCARSLQGEGGSEEGRHVKNCARKLHGEGRNVGGKTGYGAHCIYRKIYDFSVDLS